ncbi:unnamed protein product [Nezara viridula]|uniref:Neuropeptide n=1 Tax=Nezara viridula TaxID=85310 RepID=A0A9P0MYD9_NEZVI|nr:unnamed protein product [Nezara viridula]
MMIAVVLSVIICASQHSTVDGNAIHKAGFTDIPPEYSRVKSLSAVILKGDDGPMFKRCNKTNCCPIHYTCCGVGSKCCLLISMRPPIAMKAKKCEYF